MLTEAQKEHILAILEDISIDEIDKSNPASRILEIKEFPTPEVYLLLRNIYFNTGNQDLITKIYRTIFLLKDFDIPFLLDLLNHGDSSSRYGACLRLGEYTDPLAIQALAKALLEDPNNDVRFAAAKSLEKIGDLSVIPVLEHARDHDTSTDWEGFAIADAAEEAIEAILKRSRE